MIEKIPLNAIKFFYAVAKYGSVTEAAKKLFITQSAVSKQISNLEEVLNVALFDRKNKKMILTEKGEVLYLCCAKLFTDLDDCLIEIQKQNIEKRQLILSCEPTISIKWLIPRLSQFKALGHDFDVVLVTGGGAVDFDNSNVDIALRRNDFDWGNHIYSEKISDEYIAVVRNSSKQDLTDILISTSRPNFWSNLKKNNRLKKELKPYNKIELEHFYLCLEACLAGLGATVISMYMIERELEYGLFEMIVPPYKDDSAYYLLSNEPFENDPRKMIFLEWMKGEMKLNISF